MKRDNAIDVLKFLAVLCVVNSHMDACYPGRFSVLATGGALGDALFFFCSGYTLFLKGAANFFPWYVRRLRRIVPTMVICSTAMAFCLNRYWWSQINSYWFIKCILIYYVAIYIIRRWFLNRLQLVFVGLCVLILFWFYFIFDHCDHSRSLYGGDYVMWVHYFIPMLMGMALGLKRMENHLSWKMNVVVFIAGMIAHFVFAIVTRHVVALRPIEWISLPFLWIAVYGVYGFARSELVERCFLECKAVRWLVVFVGGLCLEVYLTHGEILTSRLNDFFPLNIPVLFVAIVFVAFVAKKVADVVMPVFWKSIGVVCAKCSKCAGRRSL